MNKLQKEAKALAIRLEPLYNQVADELLAGQTPGEALKAAGYYQQVTDEVLNSVTAAASIGVDGTAYALEVEKFREWYLNTNHLGGALSSNIRSSSALPAIQGVLRDGLRINNSVNALADTIQKSADTLTDVKLPKALQNLVRQSKISKGMTKELRAEISKAERYVQSLTGGPARGSKQLKTAYTQLVNSAKTGKLKEEYVTKATARQLRYVNERIARTEMANGFELSRRRAYNDDPKITHYQWELSDEHPIVDECDYYAEADLYGVGAGVYPLDSGASVPAHVNCLCTTVPILHGEEKGQYSEARSKEYLKGLSDKDRARVLGSKNATVSNSTKALKKKGVDPKAPTRAMMPASMLNEKEGR